MPNKHRHTFGPSLSTAEKETPYISRSWIGGQPGTIHIHMTSDRPENAGRELVLDLTVEQARNLADTLNWWLDPNSAANRNESLTGKGETR